MTAGSNVPLPAGHNAFVYVYRGVLSVGPGDGGPRSGGQGAQAVGRAPDGDPADRAPPPTAWY